MRLGLKAGIGGLVGITNGGRVVDTGTVVGGTVVTGGSIGTSSKPETLIAGIFKEEYGSKDIEAEALSLWSILSMLWSGYACL